MKKVKPAAIVTAVISAIILVFAVLVVRGYINSRKPAEAAAAAPQGGGQRQERQAGSQRGGGNQGGRNATAVRVKEVELGTIENSIVINGDVLTANQVAIYPAVAGKITETFFQIGDRVREGSIAAMIDRSLPGQIYSDSPVLSTISGTVLQAPVHKGDTVSTQTAVYVVGDLSSLLVETFVPERFSNAARLGLPALVSLEALPGEIFDAAVVELSPVLDSSSRTLRVLLRFQGITDTRIKAGMFATVSLVTNTRADVPVIPRGAVINTYGSWIVFTVNENNIASRKEITLGIENEDFIEVLSGLEPGELVVSAGQNFLTDGDPVRIVE